MSARVTLAAVAGAHGIGGEVRLKLFAESVDSLKRCGSVEIDGATFAVTTVRANGQAAVARLGGVESREAAEALRGKLLTIDRATLPPLGEGEYYHVDVIGLPCVTANGEPLGRVETIENFGAGDLLEVERADGTRTLVPFRLPAADLHDGRVVVDPAFLA